MKVRKILSILTVLLCFVLIGYVSALTIGLALANLMGPYIYGGNHFLIFNTYYSFNEAQIGLALNTCFLVIVLPCAWLSLIALLASTVLLNKEEKPAKIIGAILGVLIVLSVIGTIVVYSLIKGYFAISSFVSLISYNRPVIYMVASMMSALFHLVLMGLAFIPLLTMGGAIISTFVKKKQPVDVEEKPQVEEVEQQ